MTTTHSTPLGIYARSTPDFFEHESAYCSAQCPAGGAGLFATVGLYNQDTIGRLFRIHAIGLESDASSSCGFWMTQRVTIAQQYQALPIRPDFPQPPGVGLSGPVNPFGSPPAGAPQFTVNAGFTFIRNDGFFGILPMGWAWLLSTFSPSAALSITFWYTFTDAP